jgi:hypothetical protein
VSLPFAVYTSFTLTIVAFYSALSPPLPVLVVLSKDMIRLEDEEDPNRKAEIKPEDGIDARFNERFQKRLETLKRAVRRIWKSSLDSSSLTNTPNSKLLTLAALLLFLESQGHQHCGNAARRIRCHGSATNDAIREQLGYQRKRFTEKDSSSTRKDGRLV